MDVCFFTKLVFGPTVRFWGGFLRLNLRVENFVLAGVIVWLTFVGGVIVEPI